MTNKQKEIFSFKKNEKITKRKDFSKLFLKGKRLKSKYFEIITHDNKLNHRRIAIIIKKKYGKAHIRNKIKRRIREIYRLNKEKFPSKKDSAIIIKEKVNNLSFNEIRNNLFSLLRQ